VFPELHHVFRVVTIIFFFNSTSKFAPHLQKCKENEVSTSKNAPHLYFTRLASLQRLALQLLFGTILQRL